MTKTSTLNAIKQPVRIVRELIVQRTRAIPLALISVFIGLSATVCAQENIKFTQGSPSSGLDVNVKIPIATFPGRGGASLPINLTYTSGNLWRLGHLATANNQSYYQTIAEAIYAEHSTAGWRTSLDLPEIEWPKNDDAYLYSGKPYCFACTTGNNVYRVSRVYIHMPDGSTHELRASDIPFQGLVQKTGTFYAVDSSRLRYDGWGIDSGTGNSIGTLYFPDGTRFILGATNAQFIDRNGNTLNYDRSSRQWTDTIGRVINMPIPAVPQPQDYNYDIPGITTASGATTMRYTFKWRNLDDVLTLDASGQKPLRKLVASDYLPNPNAAPSNVNGPNYPQLSNQPSLFHDAMPPEVEEAAGLNTLVVGRGQSQNQLFNPVVLAEVVLPNGLSYKFSYNIYGEIDKITYPTGAVETYNYDEVFAYGDLDKPYTQASRGITSRKLSVDGAGDDIAEWKYSAPLNLITVIAPDGGKTETVKAAYGAPRHDVARGNVVYYWPFGFSNPREGTIVSESVYALPSQGGGMIRRTWSAWTVTSHDVPPRLGIGGSDVTVQAYRNPRKLKDISLILDTGGDALAKTVSYQYDTSNELTTGLDLTTTTESYFASVDQTAAQGWAIELIPAGPVASSAETIYLNDSNYSNRNILGLPTAVVLKDSSGQVVSKSETFYDEPGYPTLTYDDLSGVPDWTDPSSTARGNPTTSRRYVDIVSGIYLETHAQYDQCGNVRYSENERGIISEAVYPSTYKHAFASQSKTAVPDPQGTHGSATAFTSSSTFDLTTGRILTSVDANGLTTTYSYVNGAGTVDSMNRLRQVTRPDGGWTKYDYSDNPGDLYTYTEIKQDDTHISKAYSYIDGMGRSSRTFTVEDGTNYLATDTIYDSVGRVWKVSNPYRTTSRDGMANLSHTSNWTVSHYDDGLGRATSVTLPDGSTAQTVYNGIYTTSIDQAGKSRRQEVDALGRVIRVDEPDGNGDLRGFDAPVQATYYDYNTQGNLIHITQGSGATVQNRYFKYDALGRLTYEKQAEQVGTFTVSDPLTPNDVWSRKLVYDETINGTSYKGQLTGAEDARKVHTQFQYDNLNRPIIISYSGGTNQPTTPTVNYFYDTSRFTVSGDSRTVYNLGKLAEVQTAAVGSDDLAGLVPATSQAYNFDLMGRTIQNRQTVGSYSYAMGYTYNVGGALTSETYPSGRVTTFAYDEASRLSSVSSGGTTYASGFTFGSQGLLASYNLGNGAVESFDYNSRLQLTSIDLTKGGTQLQHYNYKYGVYNPETDALDETKDNGQIAKIEGFIGSQKQWTQKFAYDSLGRLSSAKENRGDTNAQSYLVNYDYDLFGNRYQYQSRNTNNPFVQKWVEDGDITKTSNRYASGITYDEAGNVTQDAKFLGLQFKYDANNRQVWSAGLSETTGVRAVFDGTGQRVAVMFNNALSNVSVYDAGGELVAEYGQASAGSGTQYVFSDHQGSPRVTMNNTGGVLSRHDYLPFGEDLTAGVGMRVMAQMYGQPDGVRQKYAGMEADEATGMDHTLWRKYDSMSARWTSPDPYGGSMKITSPQSLNRYAYVSNDPVNAHDSLGLMENDASVGWGEVTGLGGNGSDPNSSAHIGRQIIADAENSRDKAVQTRLDGMLAQHYLNNHNVSAANAIFRRNSDVGLAVDNEAKWGDDAADYASITVTAIILGPQGKLAGPWILEDPYSHLSDTKGANGQCAQWVQLLLDHQGTPIGLASNWIAGNAVMSDEDVAIGTAIASGFDESGHYKDQRSHNHAGFFIKKIDGGFTMLEMIRTRTANGIAMLIQLRDVVDPKGKNAGDYFHDPNSYYVIRRIL